jgi:CRP-like cAMP-binding protein
VKEGHVSKAFYFIIGGQMEVFKLKDGKKQVVRILNAGDSFGDRTMNQTNDKRTASVSSSTEVYLLHIDKGFE